MNKTIIKPISEKRRNLAQRKNKKQYVELNKVLRKTRQEIRRKKQEVIQKNQTMEVLKPTVCQRTTIIALKKQRRARSKIK